MPPSAYAASEGGDGPSHHLTIDGRPLSQSLGRSAAASGRVSLGGVLAQDTDGEITGAVTDAAGEPMADQRVELQRPASEDDGRVVAVTDMNGRFVFSRLGPGRYEVQLREDGRVIATSRPIDLSAGTMRMSGVTVALPTAPPVPPPNRRRVSADRLLGDAPVTRSFNALQAVLEPGHEVIVWDEAGRKTRGWVSSVSDAQIQIAIFFKERFLRPGRTTERIFTPDSVTRVDIVDSYWNGALIGAAIGSILAFGIYRWEDSALADSNLKGIYTLGFGTASILFSIGIGALVDGRSNRPIYERASPASRVTVAPLIGRGQMGLVARVSF